MSTCCVRVHYVRTFDITCIIIDWIVRATWIMRVRAFLAVTIVVPEIFREARDRRLDFSQIRDVLLCLQTN
jgi:hypothetical protein